MVLSLTSPVGSDFIKDFTSINTVNCDAIDDYAGPCLTSDALQSWTPQLTAVTTSPTLGTGGFTRGFYYKIFDQIYIWGEFRFGTAAIAAGSGTYIMSLPFAAKGNSGFFGGSIGETPPVGVGVIWDDSSTAGKQPLSVHLRTANTLMFGVHMGGATARELNDAVPLTWAINDGITWSCKYQREP